MASIICRYKDGTTQICTNTDEYVDITEIFSDIKVNGESIGVISNYSVSSNDEVEFITKSNLYLYDYAFYNCTGLKSVSIGEGLWGIYDSVFEECKNLETIVLPSSLRTIGAEAFENCESLRNVNIPDMVNDIGERAFANCYSITSITIPNGVDLLRNYTFASCSSLVTINFGSGLKRIEQFVFYECTSLKKVTIPDNVTYINMGAFGHCTSLETVYFGNGIETIDYDIFTNCSSLNKIYITKSELPETYEYTFRDIARGGTLYYPIGSGYSQWLSTDPYYLGYYGWNGVEMDPEDFPDNPDAPSVGSDTRIIVFEASGGTQPIDFTWSNVSYNDISTKAEAADSWIELDYEGLISSSPIITQYLVTAGVNTGEPRTTYFTFTGSTSSGEIKTETITIYQKNNNGDLPNDSDMSTGCYINLDSYEHTFPATGGTFSVLAHFGFPGTNGLKARVFSGAVYPILWCTAENAGGGIEDDGTEASEIWEITMTNNNFDTERTATITFSYTNYYGESTSVVFTAIQEAGAGEDNTEPKVGVSSSRLNVNSDGTPEYSSTTDIKGFYQAVTINDPIVNGDWIHLGTGVPYEGVIYGYDTRIDYPISFDANDGASRTGTITFSGIDTNGNVLTAVCNVIQAGAADEPDEPETPDIPVDGDEYIGPIWKDVEYNFGGVEMVEYGIYTEVPYRLPGNGGIRYYDKLLFAGRSYARPDTGNNVILVNKICQDYMDIPLLKKGLTSLGGGYNTFKLKSADGSTLYRQYSFVNDWSYGEFETGLLSRPILKDHSKVFRNQLLPFSVFGAAEQVAVPYEISYADGTKWNSTVYETRGVTTEMFPYPSIKDGAVSYSINNKIYTISDECVQYVLYYINPWGGYDWFPIRGRVVEMDNLAAYTYTQNFNNQTWEFGKRRYLTEITKHFTLYTQWMSEEESSRMWYLLQSNTVYLHNLVEDKIYPVVITNTEQEHKKRLLGTRISYQIEVDLSQNRERI